MYVYFQEFFMAKTVEELLQENNDLLRERNRSGGGDAPGSKSAGSALAMAGFDKVAGGLSKLASGSADMSDVLTATTGFIKQFGAVGQGAGTLLESMGQGVINVNNTLRQTGQVGITFGNDLGGFNAAV
jgi:X-X-X-Leu-X-X-Gly heptad repeat protein